MQFEFPGVRRVVGALAFLFLSACSGGGGDEGSSRDVQLSASSLAFSAIVSDASAPAPQAVTATFDPGIANIAAVHSGPAIERVDVVINGSTAQLNVIPAAPATLGAGEFKATIAVTAYFCGDAACTRLEAGASRTITASYQIAPIVSSVAPNAAVAGATATVSVRGAGFQGFAIEGVIFGSTPATSISVTSGTEIRATHPALTAGSYPVTLQIPTLATPVTTTATLVVVDPLAPTTQTLAWPAPVTNVYALEYDAQRRALLATTDATGAQLARFPYSAGTWQAPQTAALADVRDAALSSDAAQWLAITAAALTPVNPETLALGTAVAAPSLPTDSSLKTIAVLNTNDALITTGTAGATATNLYSYAVRTGVLAQLPQTLLNATARASTNGATIGFIHGTATSDPAAEFVIANASTGQIVGTGIVLNQNAIPPAFDREATRFILNGTRVFASDTALLGTLPDTTGAVVIRPDGKRAYTYDTAVNALRVFDISETKNGEAYTPTGDPVPLAGAPGSSIKMAISADATTLFIAGSTQLVIQPTPAL